MTIVKLDLEFSKVAKFPLIFRAFLRVCNADSNGCSLKMSLELFEN